MLTAPVNTMERALISPEAAWHVIVRKSSPGNIAKVRIHHSNHANC